MKNSKIVPVTREPLKLCFVVPDLPLDDQPKQDINSILGVAQHFAACGDTITLLWCPWPHELEALGEDGLKALKEEYFEKFLIYIEVLPESEELIPTWVSRDKQSILAYHFLRKSRFDMVFFPAEQGIGYYSLIAKETGTFLDAPPFIVIAQSPIAWRSEADKFFIGNENDVTVAYMEKHCVENADCLVLSSQYLKNWMQDQKWSLPKNTRVIGPVRPHAWRAGITTQKRDRPNRKIAELVVPPAVNYRDGLPLFCDALDQLSASYDDNLTITSLGIFGKILGEHTGGLLLRQARNWKFHLNLLPRMEPSQVLDYIRTRDCAVVLPNYTSSTNLWAAFCVEEGIPFVSTNAGSLPEYVAGKTAKETSAEAPNAKLLAERIENNLRKGFAICKSGNLVSKAPEEWNKLAADKKLRKRKSADKSSNELVSIVLVHHDRPEMLKVAVNAVRAQDYENIELIVVDDGSKMPESKAVLKSLEADFKKRKWKIIREKNQYLGAARNCGVRASRGSYILFIDDDNALFKSAVTSYVRAMEKSGADICTSFQRIFYEDRAPENEKMGYIQYFTLGGSLDLGFINNVFGDANSIIKREVFDKIGYVTELKSGGGEDWEFFARAVMNGLKLRVIPEPLYWYRTSPGGMFRKSHWYDTRKLIMDSYKKGGFQGLDLIYHMVLANNVGIWEREGFKDNLRFTKSDEIYLKLSELDPNSDEAMETLARAAAREGRPDTAMGVLGRTSMPGFSQKIQDLLEHSSQWEHTHGEIGAAIPVHNRIEASQYQNFQRINGGSNSGVSEIYVEGEDRLYLISNQETPTMAVLPGGCASGTLGVTLNVSLDEAITRRTEFLVLLAEPGSDPKAMIRKAGKGQSPGSSGWVQLSVPHEGRKISALLSEPSQTPMNIIVAFRSLDSDDTRPVSGCFSGMEYVIAHTASSRRRPRTGAPAHLKRAREWTKEEKNGVWLATDYPSELPLLLIDPQRGVYLRPHESGMVIGAVDRVIPPFVSELRAQVEIAHEDAGPFEFAIAVYNPGRTPDWQGEVPDECLGFSGWLKVEDKFRLHDLSVKISQVSRVNLSLHLAIRLSDGAVADPASSFFRKLVFLWDQ